MKPHFGQWLRKIRVKLGLSQTELAPWLRLKSYQAVYGIEEKPDRKVRDITAEALAELLGYGSVDELDRAWKSGAMPDLDAVRARIGERLPSKPTSADADLMETLRQIAEPSGASAQEWAVAFREWLQNQPEGVQLMIVEGVRSRLPKRHPYHRSAPQSRRTA